MIRDERLRGPRSPSSGRGTCGTCATVPAWPIRPTRQTPRTPHHCCCWRQTSRGTIPVRRIDAFQYDDTSEPFRTRWRTEASAQGRSHRAAVDDRGPGRAGAVVRHSRRRRMPSFERRAAAQTSEARPTMTSAVKSAAAMVRVPNEPRSRSMSAAAGTKSPSMNRRHTLTIRIQQSRRRRRLDGLEPPELPKQPVCGLSSETAGGHRAEDDAEQRRLVRLAGAG